MKKITILLAILLLLSCKKQVGVEQVTVTVYSTKIGNANYNEPQKNYHHIVVINGAHYSVIRSWVISSFSEVKFERKEPGEELYYSNFETRFQINKSDFKIER